MPAYKIRPEESRAMNIRLLAQMIASESFAELEKRGVNETEAIAKETAELTYAVARILKIPAESITRAVIALTNGEDVCNGW
jgi:hypothetical protein